MAESSLQTDSRDHRAIVRVASECARAGLDVQLYCEWASADAIAFGLPPAVERADATALLLGSSRNLWPKLERWVHQRVREGDAPAHPVDEYTEAVVAGALKMTALQHRTYYVHRRYDGHYIGFQRIGEALGMAVVGPVKLAIHRVYGPWFGYRALVLFRAQGTQPLAPTAFSPCGGCVAQPCIERRNALEPTVGRQPQLSSKDYRGWAEVRQVCPVGKSWSYGASQLEYHYTHNRGLLRP